MKKQDLIKEMVAVADYFDKNDMEKEADVMDGIIQKVAQQQAAQAQPAQQYSKNPNVNKAMAAWHKSNPNATPQQIQETTKRYEAGAGVNQPAAQATPGQVVKNVVEQRKQRMEGPNADLKNQGYGAVKG